MDVMGGIADYSGSLVLQMPISLQAQVHIALRTDGLFRLISGPESHGQVVEIPKEDLLGPEGEVSLPYIRQALGAKKEWRWTAYVLGCFWILALEKGIPLTGADIEVESDVPNGKGVSSSAALEVATIRALQQLHNLEFSGTELAILAQRCENLVVGAPCGLMDQLASAYGVAGQLLPIVCQPDLLGQPLALPNDLYFIGLDSGVRHSVGGASYSDVRTAAFMGYSVIARHTGASQEDLAHARETGDWSALPYKGYLTNISPSDFSWHYRPILPNRLSMREFEEHYGPSIDSVTRPQGTHQYDILPCTTHPVYENFRVTQFQLLLESLIHKGEKDEALLTQMGELMYQSHTSYSACGLGCEATDELVTLAKQVGPRQGIYGAKITGGGSGGTVCVLAWGDLGLETAHSLMSEFRRRRRQNHLLLIR